MEIGIAKCHPRLGCPATHHLQGIVGSGVAGDVDEIKLATALLK